MLMGLCYWNWLKWRNWFSQSLFYGQILHLDLWTWL